MAIIRREQKMHLGSVWNQVIKCSVRGVFSVNLPPVVEEASGKTEVEGTTLEEAMDAQRKLIVEFSASSREIRKVIAYKCETPDRHCNGFHVGATINVRCAVFNETCIKNPSRHGMESLVYHYDPTDSQIPDNILHNGLIDRHGHGRKSCCIVPYSVGVEMFFVRISRQVKHVAKALTHMNTPEGLAEIIERETRDPLGQLFEIGNNWIS